MAAPYSYAKFTDVVTSISNRLYDPNQLRWTAAEVGALLMESEQTWNVLSQFWRQDFTFPLVANQWWYDLRAQPGTLIPCTVAQYDVITKIQRHLLEPPTPAAWTGSSQFAMSDLLQACQRRQDEVLGTTGVTIVRSLVNAPLTNRVVLPDNTIDIRRAMWMSVDPTTYPNKILKQSDAWATRAFNPGYAQAGPATGPLKWMQNTETPISFDVDIAPPINGQYETLTTQSGGSWVQGTNAVLSTMPNDWSWVFIFGALADLFARESLAQDPLRAAYCRARFEEGVGLMRLTPVLLDLRINDRPVSVGSVNGGDRFNPLWQAKAAAAPTSFYTFMNLLGVGPKPNSSPYGARAVVCRNIDITNFYVQVPRDALDVVIDYAQHLAMLKEGGQEFYQTISLYQNLQRQCALYNSKLREMGFFEMPQLDLSILDENERNPRYSKGAEPKATAAT